MPLCLGLPDGACPKKRNDSTVRNGEGDLMLCPDCNKTRFQLYLEQQGKSVGREQPATNKHLALETVPIRSDTATRVSTRKQRAKATATTAPAAGGTSASSRNTSRKSNISESDVVICAACRQQCVDNSKVLTCAICTDVYDQNCSGLTNDVFETLLSIVKLTEWVCVECRNACRSKMHQLQSTQAKAAEQISDIHVSLAVLQQEVQAIQAIQRGPCASEWPPLSSVQPVGMAARPKQNENDTNIVMTVHNTLRDISRRKSNVVVSGLPESNDDDDDEAMFLNFCEENLTIKPSILPNSCRRLGRKITSDPRPRRLLVRLRSDSSAADVLAAAKKLKFSDNEFARSVYINRDLSPAEAKLAYERRLKLRERQAAATSEPPLASTTTPPETVNSQQATTTMDVVVTSENTDSSFLP